MSLELFVILEVQPMHDPHNGCRIGVQSLGQRAYAQKDVFARVLKDRSDNFLALGTEKLDSLS